MELPDDCWVVTTGEYSDYRIEAVTTTEARAQELARELNERTGPWGYEAEIAHWKVNTLDGAIRMI
jgi:hypothetical protein